MTGWIKIHRKIMEHWVYEKPEYLHAWITIIMTVNHKDKKTLIHGDLVDCKRGQSLLSLYSWVRLFGRGWTIQKVRTFFKLLKNDAMINTEGLQKTTRLTVCKYDSYQDEQHTDNTQTTDKQHTANTQITTTKEGKNDKERKRTQNNLSLYAKELFENRKAKYAGKYLLFAKALFKGLSGYEAFSTVASLKKQVTYEQFVALSLKAKHNKVNLFDLLVGMENYDKIGKGKSVSLTMHTWMNRDAKRS